MALVVAAAGVAAFLVGAMNPATTLARLKGSDIRASGSGNPGATNAGRVLGRRWGVLVGVLDILKGLVPTLVALSLLGITGGLVVGVTVVLGHMFSPYLRFRGGKGVATSLGAILAVHPVAALLILVVFAVGLLAFRYVGRGAILACVALVVLGLLQVNGVALPGGAGTGEAEARMVGWWLAGIGVIVLARHRSNVAAWSRGSASEES